MRFSSPRTRQTIKGGNSAKDGPFVAGIILFALCVPVLLFVVVAYAGCNAKDFCARMWFKKVLHKEPPVPCDPHGRVGWMDWKIASVRHSHGEGSDRGEKTTNESIPASARATSHRATTI